MRNLDGRRIEQLFKLARAPGRRIGLEIMASSFVAA
jgi:hypothetical protein